MKVHRCLTSRINHCTLSMNPVALSSYSVAICSFGAAVVGLPIAHWPSGALAAVGAFYLIVGLFSRTTSRLGRQRNLARNQSTNIGCRQPGRGSRRGSTGNGFALAPNPRTRWRTAIGQTIVRLCDMHASSIEILAWRGIRGMHRVTSVLRRC